MWKTQFHNGDWPFRAFSITLWPYSWRIQMNMFGSVVKGALVGLGVAAALMPIHATAASEWPTRPITMVVPFPAGGATDIVGRMLAQQLTDRLGQPVIVENRAGANATIGMQQVANAKADGYTILYNTSSLALSPALYNNLSFDPVESFEPVTTTATVPLVLLVNSDLPVDTVEELVDYAKNQPGSLNFASSGSGNITHLAGFLFNQGAGISAQHVPYKGTAPALVDIMGGQVDYMMGTVNDAIPHIESGRVKALAVTTMNRVDIYPDIPTVHETVIPDFDLSAWQGVMTPAGVSDDIIQKLNQTIIASMQSDEVTRQLSEQGAFVLGSTPQEYEQYLESELAYWKNAVEEAGVKQE